MADFALLEALLHEPGSGYFLLERHLARLGASATHFGFPFDLEHTRAQLALFARGLPATPRKVRLELFADRALFLEHKDLRPSTTVRAALAATPVDSRDELLRHKTSRRAVYERALATRPAGTDDVVLWNERGELTETSSANLVLALGGRRVTPPVACGLLPGTFRAELLARGELEERVLQRGDLARAEGIFLVNSVRRFCPIELRGEGA